LHLQNAKMPGRNRCACATGSVAISPGASSAGARVICANYAPGVGQGNFGRQTHSYSITLEANQYLRAVATQLVNTVVVELDGPDRKKVLEVDTRNFSKPSRIVWVAEAAGEYRISVSGAGHSYQFDCRVHQGFGREQTGGRLRAHQPA
jgi:hypothetical protein